MFDTVNWDESEFRSGRPTRQRCNHEHDRLGAHHAVRPEVQLLGSVESVREGGLPRRSSGEASVGAKAGQKTPAGPQRRAAGRPVASNVRRLEREANLELHRSRRLVRSRDTEAGAARPNPRLDQVAVRVERQVRDRRVRRRARELRRRVPVRDRGLIERVEQIHPDREVRPGPPESRARSTGRSSGRSSPSGSRCRTRGPRCRRRSLECRGVELPQRIRAAPRTGIANEHHTTAEVRRTGDVDVGTVRSCSCNQGYRKRRLTPLQMPARFQSLTR